jgi:hypothetical protein
MSLRDGWPPLSMIRAGYRSGTNVPETKMLQKNSLHAGHVPQIGTCRRNNQWMSFQYSFLSR